MTEMYKVSSSLPAQTTKLEALVDQVVTQLGQIDASDKGLVAQDVVEYEASKIARRCTGLDGM